MQSFVVFGSATGVACSSGIRFHSTGQPGEQLSERQGACSGRLALNPSQIPFKIPLLSRFSAILVNRSACFGTSAA